MVIMYTAGLVHGFYIYLMSYCLLFCYESLFGELDFLDKPLDQLIHSTSGYFRNYILELNHVKVK